MSSARKDANCKSGEGGLGPDLTSHTAGKEIVISGSGREPQTLKRYTTHFTSTIRKDQCYILWKITHLVGTDTFAERGKVLVKEHTKKRKNKKQKKIEIKENMNLANSRYQKSPCYVIEMRNKSPAERRRKRLLQA